MAAPFLDLDSSELVALERAVSELSGMTNDFRPEWPAVTKAISRAIASRFRQEGPGWAPLAKSTQRDRLRKGYGAAHPILVREGDLRRSFLDGSVQMYAPTQMSYESPSEIAPHLHWGAPKANIPARPIVVAEELLPIAQRAFEEAFVARANQVWHAATGRGTFGGRSSARKARSGAELVAAFQAAS